MLEQFWLIRFSYSASWNINFILFFVKKSDVTPHHRAFLISPYLSWQHASITCCRASRTICLFVFSVLNLCSYSCRLSGTTAIRLKRMSWYGSLQLYKLMASNSVGFDDTCSSIFFFFFVVFFFCFVFSYLSKNISSPLIRIAFLWQF